MTVETSVRTTIVTMYRATFLSQEGACWLSPMIHLATGIIIGMTYRAKREELALAHVCCRLCSVSGCRQRLSLRGAKRRSNPLSLRRYKLVASRQLLPHHRP